MQKLLDVVYDLDAGGFPFGALERALKDNRKARREIRERQSARVLKGLEPNPVLSVREREREAEAVSLTALLSAVQDAAKARL